MQETQVRCLAQEDPQEKETASHSSILAWEIPWTEEPGGLQSMGSQRMGHDWATKQKTNWATGRLSNLSVVTQLVSGEGGVQRQVV